MVLSFICTFVEKATEYSDDGEVMKLNSLYSELDVEICGRRWIGRGNFNRWMVLLRKREKELNENRLYVRRPLWNCTVHDELPSSRSYFSGLTSFESVKFPYTLSYEHLK